jgi:hypothetical protein
MDILLILDAIAGYSLLILLPASTFYASYVLAKKGKGSRRRIDKIGSILAFIFGLLILAVYAWFWNFSKNF